MSRETDKYELGVLESQFRIAFDAQIDAVGNSFANRHGWLNVSDRSEAPFLGLRDARSRYFAGRIWEDDGETLKYSWEINESGGSLYVHELIGGSERSREPATAEDLRLALAQLVLLKPDVL